MRAMVEIIELTMTPIPVQAGLLRSWITSCVIALIMYLFLKVNSNRYYISKYAYMAIIHKKSYF